MVLDLGLVVMELDQVELVLVQRVLDLVALDQVDMGLAALEQVWVVLEQGQVVLDLVVFLLDWALENHQSQV